MASFRISVAATVLLLAAAAPAGATFVTGSFTGTVGNNDDQGNLTYLSDNLHYGDHITGSFSFDTADINAPFGADTLVITVNDTTSEQSATYYGDTGTDGYYGNGSFFGPSGHAYYLEDASGAADNLSQFVLLTFLSPTIQSGDVAPSFTLGSGTGSYGEVEGDYYYGTEDGYLDFSIDSATMIGAALPEPASLAVFGLGLLALVGTRRARA